MTIASLPFLGFALLAALLVNLLPSAVLRRIALVPLNVWFLTTFTPTYEALLPLVGFLTGGYAALRVLQSRPEPKLFWSLLAALILAFFWLKKYSFLPASLFLEVAYTTIGLSYIFFRVIHMVIDVYEGSLQRPISLVDYVNYTLNFTTLVSGPIQRFQDFAVSQSEHRPALTWVSAGRAAERIVIGLFKVIVLATVFSTLHQNSLAAWPTAATTWARVETALAITVDYTIYLYFNFSGYTDIVIGVAHFLRLDLPENFNRPFFATNFMDFWGRWHMTLSNWLKVYVYNPLVISLMRWLPSPAIEPFLGVTAFFVTFFLIGLWHGQTSVFAVYGLLLAVGVSGNKLYQLAMIRLLDRKGYRAVSSRPLYRTLARGLTFTWFNLSLVCFWGNWDQIAELTIGLGVAGLAMLAIVLMVASSILLAAIDGGGL